MLVEKKVALRSVCSWTVSREHSYICLNNPPTTPRFLRQNQRESRPRNIVAALRSFRHWKGILKKVLFFISAEKRSSNQFPKIQFHYNCKLQIWVAIKRFSSALQFVEKSFPSIYYRRSLLLSKRFLGLLINFNRIIYETENYTECHV